MRGLRSEEGAWDMDLDLLVATSGGKCADSREESETANRKMGTTNSGKPGASSHSQAELTRSRSGSGLDVNIRTKFTRPFQ